MTDPPTPEARAAVLASELRDLHEDIERERFDRTVDFLVLALSFFGVLPVFTVVLFLLFDVHLLIALGIATLLPLASLARVLRSSKRLERLLGTARRTHAEWSRAEADRGD